METFDVKLLKRAIGQKKRYQSVNTFYGDKSWVRNLDIVNELGGHTGCVNALSWSKSGNLLASGSDDTYLNIWDYNPANLAKPFTLNTSVSTGHTANIFSVKFMPHSSDRTVITCAGDSDVRVFDLEYGGGNQQEATGGSTDNTRSRRFNDFFANARWLSAINTNARVYRSHADRAKRIVTESSPFLFLSCSEDGEVRQWDLRQPSSAYPRPRHGRRTGLSPYNNDSSEDAPPPLISYRRYGLDLNSISCSGSQPQYIALGGAHLHCFLHDRRMLGRDIRAEEGKPSQATPSAGTDADEVMREATKCVRRFAPNNKRKMRTTDSGHITACKISDARPNELISSWSGDHIYSFDIVKSPDARDIDERQEQTYRRSQIRSSSDRKRKRTKATTSSSSLGEHTLAARRLRRVPDEQEEEGHTALGVRFENNETDTSSIQQEDNSITGIPSYAQDILLTEAERVSDRIARLLVRLRKTLFDFSTVVQQEGITATELSTEPTPYTEQFSKALVQANILLPEMDGVIRAWSYPITTDSDEVMSQNTLRRNRQSSWRFVQAAGCLAKALGGQLPTQSAADSRMVALDIVKPASREGKAIDTGSQFCYDFLKAILLWLQGGKEAVLAGFRKPPDLREDSARYPLDETDSIESFPEKLRNYLLDMADEETPVIDLGTNRFERDELRHVFQDQKAAVQGFIRALISIELRTHQGPSDIISTASGGVEKRIMDKGAAARFWGLKVGRSLLMTAAHGVNFDFVNRAFGGLAVHLIPETNETMDFDEGNDAEETETVLESIGLADSFRLRAEEEADEDDHQSILIEDELGDEDDDDEDGNAEYHVEHTDSNSDDDDGDEDDATHGIYRSRLGFGRVSALRARVNSDVPFTTHTKTYRGHCNTRTVKDVNYFGLDDEYVVSGSDDGHFFIWDRKTMEVVNILEGDGEVVNVVQGHPYEPMIACSGIDSTIKIFAPGGNSRERYDAGQGTNIANPAGSVHSSLRYGGRRRRVPQNGDDEDEESANEGAGDADAAATMLSDDQMLSDPTVSRNGLKSRRAMDRQYQIMTQNDVERRRGIGDAFVSQGMLARFAAALQRGELHGLADQGINGGEGGTIVLDDNCSVM